MKTNIFYFLLFVLAMTIIATADHPDSENISDNVAPVTITRYQPVPKQKTPNAFYQIKYIPDTTTLLIRQ